MVKEIVFWVLSTFKWGALIMSLYLIFIALGNLLPKKSVPHRNPITRFAIVVPAHNEEKVIGNLLRNLKEMDYPRELYDIYVICDRCRDRTAEIAEAEGAIVLRREGQNRKGKGAALDWGLEQIFSRRGRSYYDAFCFFDADNLVKTDFLQVMNDHYLFGQNMMQAYIDLKNPKTNLFTRTFYTQQHSTNFLWHGGKARWGLGNYLLGTGMCIKGDLLAKYGWKAESLTEDLEFSLKMTFEGEKVYWVEETKVFNEVPTDFKTIWLQRQRWAIGGWYCFFRYFFTSLFYSVKNLNFRLFDMAIYLLSTAWGALALFCGLISLLNGLLNLVRLSPDLFTTIFGLIYALSYCPLGVHFSKVNIRENFPYVILYMTLIPALTTAECLLALFKVREKNWFHTPHKAEANAEIRL